MSRNGTVHATKETTQGKIVKNSTKQQLFHRREHGKRWIQDGSGHTTSAQGWVKNLDESASMNLIVAQEMFEKKIGRLHSSSLPTEFVDWKLMQWFMASM